MIYVCVVQSLLTNQQQNNAIIWFVKDNDILFFSQWHGNGLFVARKDHERYQCQNMIITGHALAFKIAEHQPTHEASVQNKLFWFVLQ